MTIGKTQSKLYEDEHELFRESVRAFLEREVAPYTSEWEREGIVPRELFSEAGRHGLLGMAVPEEFGGAGARDFRFNAVISEEAARVAGGMATLGLTVQNDVCLPYFLEYANPRQADRWLAGITSGELITAIAMTEPGTGSDLRAIQARAVRSGDSYVLNGSKTFITNGINSDLIIVAARTVSAGATGGLSLLVAERGMEGLERGRNLEKIGQHAQDTAELFFNDVRVPTDNLLGEEGAGLRYLVSNLPQERMSIAIFALAAADVALGWTIDYVSERKVFGRPIGTFQHPRFVLAECRTEITVARSFLEDCVLQLVSGSLAPERAAMAKWWCTELQGRVLDRCLQLFGGYGYMLEYPIGRAYADARATRIYGGANEIMKEIIGRSMGLEDRVPSP